MEQIINNTPQVLNIFKKLIIVLLASSLLMLNLFIVFPAQALEQPYSCSDLLNSEGTDWVIYGQIFDAFNGTLITSAGVQADHIVHNSAEPTPQAIVGSGWYYFLGNSANNNSPITIKAGALDYPWAYFNSDGNPNYVIPDGESPPQFPVGQGCTRVDFYLQRGGKLFVKIQDENGNFLNLPPDYNNLLALYTVDNTQHTFDPVNIIYDIWSHSYSIPLLPPDVEYKIVWLGSNTPWYYPSSHNANDAIIVSTSENEVKNINFIIPTNNLPMVSGQIIQQNNNLPLSNVTVTTTTFSGTVQTSSSTTTTDDNGVFSIALSSNLNLNSTIVTTPTLIEWGFDPVQQIALFNGGNLYHQDFIATPLTSRTPVLIIPGIAGTYAADTSNDRYWLLNRGVPPYELAIDPLAHVYDDLIKTLTNVGYIEDSDIFEINNANLFVVKYDWRLPPAPAPTTGIYDGHISGITASSISDTNFEYGIDYFGYYLEKAAEQYRQEHPGQTLDKVDVIVHSTGGIIARAYIQSDAYGGLYDGVHHLPTINNLIMVGVPNRGAAKAWNPLHNDWKDDFIAYQVVLSKVLNRAFVKLNAGEVVTGPDYDGGQITKNSSSILGTNGKPDPIKFIKYYVPSIGSLLSTYDFIDTGNGLTDINQNNSPYVDYRNNLLLDLNNGYDTTNAGNPNGFTSSSLVNTVTIIYGNSKDTLMGVKVQTAPLPIQNNQGILTSPAHFAPFNSFTEEIIPKGSPWYVNTFGDGDGTVPTISAIGQFDNCSCATIQGFADISHTELMSDENVQHFILDTLGVPYSEDDISSQWLVWIKGLKNVVSVINDPVEFILTDGTGKRFGYTTSTGPLTEIPNSVWYGGADGAGWIFGPVQEPLSVQLRGLNESYYVMVSGNLGDKKGGIILSGEMLESGSTITAPIVLTETTPPTIQSITRLDSNPTSATNVSFIVDFSEGVTGIDSSDFNLTTTGVIGASINGISGTGSTRSVSVNTGTGNGTIRLDISPTATIFDLVGNPMAGLPFISGETYTINDISTFADVEMNYWAWQYIERLYNSGITGGCSTNPLSYCPTSPVTRAQMAIFLLKGIHGSSFTPPAVGGSTGFTDVDVTHWAAAWIKQLAAESITGGCGNGNYCPENSVTRAQMAIFLLKAMHGSAYSPPPATGSFTDVPVGYWAAAWIEQLAAEGITSGCAAGLYCPENPVTRDQMAVFLVKAFNLP